MSKKSITKNYIYNMIYQVLILVLPLITTPYLSRVLGAEGIGIYGYTYTIVTYFILFGSLGVALYGQREIAYAQENVEKRKKVFIEIVLFRFITIGLATVAYYFLFMNGEEYKVYYRILLIELIAGAFDISWFFQGMEEFKKTVIRNVLVRICSVALVFVLVKTKEDLAIFTLIYSIADLVGNLSLWIYLPQYLRGIKVKNINVFRHLPQITLLFIPQIANQLYKMLDTTMIGKLIQDKSEVGFYEQGQKVIRLLLTIVTSLGVVMIPRMASTFASGDKEKVNSYMKMSFRFVFFLAFPIMFGIMSISKDFVPIFFGEGYEKVVILINIISPIILLMGLANVLGTQYLLPTKRQKEYTISIVIGIIINFILNYILILKWGAIGASISTVISELIIVFLYAQFVKKEIDFKELFKTSYRYFIIGLVMFVFCRLTQILIYSNIFKNLIISLSNIFEINTKNMTSIISIIGQIFIGIVVYIGILIKIKDEYIYLAINKIKNKLKKAS